MNITQTVFTVQSEKQLSGFSLDGVTYLVEKINLFFILNLMT
jgi:hypothetical protein